MITRRGLKALVLLIAYLLSYQLCCSRLDQSDRERDGLELNATDTLPPHQGIGKVGMFMSIALLAVVLILSGMVIVAGICLHLKHRRWHQYSKYIVPAAVGLPGVSPSTVLQAANQNERPLPEHSLLGFRSNFECRVGRHQPRGILETLLEFSEADSGYASCETTSVESGSMNGSRTGVRLKSQKRADSHFITKVAACVPFTEPLGVLVCGHSGREYINYKHDFAVRIPAGAISVGSTVSIELGISSYGPFDFPTGMQPVSPIIWLHAREPISLLFWKSVELVLPHCMKIESELDIQSLQLCFLKAGHLRSKKGKFEFSLADGQALFSGGHHGILYTRHFCFNCIAAKLSAENLQQVKYCLITVEPLVVSRPAWRVYYCVSFFLKTCIETIRQQHSGYGEEYRFTTKQFSFAGGQIPHIKIEFERCLPQGWLMALKSGCTKIKACEVSFWKLAVNELQLMEELKIYPPRFIIHVSGEASSGSTVAVVHFRGTAEELWSEIHLPYSRENGQTVNHALRDNSRVEHSGASGIGTQAVVDQSGTLSDASLVLEEATRERAVLNQQLQLATGSDSSPIAITLPSHALGNLHVVSPLCNTSMRPHPPVPLTPGMLVPVRLSLKPHACLHARSRVDLALPPDCPTNQELEELTQHIIGIMQLDWTKLLSYLGIPDHLIPAIKEECTVRERVLRMLKEWRSLHARQATRLLLAENLRRADHRLRRAADALLQQREA